MKQTPKHLTLILAIGAALFIPSAVHATNTTSNHTPVTLAHAGNATETAKPHTAETLQKLAENSGMADSGQTFSKQIQERIQQAKEKLKQKQAAATQKEAKLDDAKKRICANHQSHINKIMNNMDARRQATFDRISAASVSAQEYYAKKHLSISNYDDLVSAVTIAKAAAETSKNAQTSIPSLDCNSQKPHDSLQQFRDKRVESIDTMKIYRDAVKKLVAAIKTATHSPDKTNNNQSGTHS